ncbi:hypothetical protein K1T71_003637 [Dendrolimus kikuchii]|uniref:Uncharacterized protein n=1 Tax=Dendrolimus kikuchii TaxID=765133 RepID=A0ACC1D8H2_9NEOP|nr:hypothetical protein K1T71_003637 [Dendrolimus kikuchii]
MYKFSLLVLIVFNNFLSILSSNGDRSIIYQNCLRNCIFDNCTDVDDKFKSNQVIQDVWSKIFMWSCSDECKYQCMWQTVDAFQERLGIVPKFYGKWPFVRVLGAQEPASAFASILNLATNVYMYSKMRMLFPVRSTPLVLFWHVFAIICMNAWIWSMIFHIKDTPFTEFMDYVCALSMVGALFVAAVVRVFYGRRNLTLLTLAYPLFYFANHVTYLYTGRVDYDFNMKVNIFYGVTGSLIWLTWACYHFIRGAGYMWRLVAFTTLSGVTLALEVFDFPPLGDVWDAHAIWHLSTAPLPLLFYKFVIDDLTRIRLIQYEKLPMKSS